MGRFIFLVGIGILLLLLYRKMSTHLATPANRLNALLLFGAGVLVLAVVTGRASGLYAVVAGLMAFVGRLAQLGISNWPIFASLWRKYQQSQGPSSATPGQSQVETHWLSMTLDHDTGALDGQVLKGRYCGKTLSALDLEVLKSLYAELADDPESARLLSAFVQSKFAQQWDTGASSTEPAPDSALSISEARKILGVHDNATRDEITQAHRRLMSRLHPDKGGSTYLATRVNLAKDLLLHSNLG